METASSLALLSVVWVTLNWLELPMPVELLVSPIKLWAMVASAHLHQLLFLLFVLSFVLLIQLRMLARQIDFAALDPSRSHLSRRFEDIAIA